MKTWIYISSVAVAALSASAGLPRDFTVPMNVTREIGAWGAVHEDCSSLGHAEVRVLTSPQHGTISVRTGRDYSRFPDTNARHVCNSRTTPTVQAWFKPERNYVGSDTVTFDVIYPDGKSSQDTISIEVK